MEFRDSYIEFIEELMDPDLDFRKEWLSVHWIFRAIAWIMSLVVIAVIPILSIFNVISTCVVLYFESMAYLAKDTAGLRFIEGASRIRIAFLYNLNRLLACRSKWIGNKIHEEASCVFETWQKLDRILEPYM